MKTVINVLGAERSGTTLMDVMLGSGPDTFSTGEVYSFFRPTRKHHFTLDCSCGSQDCSVWAKLARMGESEFHLRLFQEFKLNFVVDSSKNLCWLIDRYNRLPSDIRVINLMMWKDPVDLCYSHWKRKQNLDRWRDAFVTYYQRFFDLGLPFLSVELNELTSNPATELQAICHSIGMTYFPGKENFWLDTHHFLFGSHGIRQQVASKKSYIYQKEEWPEEFRQQLPEITKQIKNDQRLSETLKILEGHKVGPDTSVTEGPSSIKKPFWYYIQKSKMAIRRYFPTDYQVKNVNYIYGKKTASPDEKI